MAIIQPGTSGTFKTTTAEGRLIETVCFLELQEANTAKNPNSKNVVQGDFSIQDLVFSGSYNFPTEQTIATDGSLSIVASSYLQDVSIAPGSNNPTFKSTVLERYVLEVLMYLQGLERNSAKNPQNKNNITGSFNSDTGVYSGGFSLPILMTLDATGKPTFEAVEYLLT